MGGGTRAEPTTASARTAWTANAPRTPAWPGAGAEVHLLGRNRRALCRYRPLQHGRLHLQQLPLETNRSLQVRCNTKFTIFNAKSMIFNSKF